MLKVIKIATKELQTRHHTIALHRADLDMLIADLRSNKSKNSYVLHNCDLGTRCAGETSNKFTALCFANGIIKIQNADTESMTVFENNVRIGLLLSDAVEESSTSANTVPLAR